ncbi:Developmentally_regulated GTP-binding protein 1 [Hexamita inflata]|uniref:Developmentally regulated GTP-binding protein 1 n=1 Tax=Hexamita inflata TaxID=28002 RepID=A0AA86PE81_9EUKA|nr:Developmentally regulated GTP-binding protein 1 [Hexamita inflata]CAI9940814.1 Developmentally regulated GTP-binding protein 1 [Hexamita inflata]CAI9952147.1 Developmentally regulated GTP-binding protein 1 [Hexamita inflata]
MGILEQIADIKYEMSRTQKNKATEYHLGRLKARIAQLEAKLIEEASRSSGNNQNSFEVSKLGQARVALVGFPSTGKSSLLCTLTGTKNSEIAAYEFTTLTCIPGQISINGASIQLLDLPGIICGAADGKGKGKQVIATARTADVIIIMLDALRAEEERIYLERELFKMGVRLNQKPVDITVKRVKSGGVKVNFTCDQSHLDDQTVRAVMQEFDVHNCEVTVRENATVDQLIDSLSSNRVYIPAIYAVNKIDITTIESVNWFAENGYVPISVEKGYGLDYLKQQMWEKLAIVRIYTKKRAERPDLSEAIYLKQGDTIATVCKQIHKDMINDFGYAEVWGKSAKTPRQRVGIFHQIADGDVIQIFTK